ncbi:hypothetical protein BPAE_0015g00360 [Botrytis paeoniae]|uniref:Uncharacterized protein n=1 Tax=Botrytis paeoniae TaxID=278948 RepID=A0A4Z1G1Y4_9HELO|nr:hypothetical protein BPAE_0015g00360 [Botrytis paeoniae]
MAGFQSSATRSDQGQMRGTTPPHHKHLPHSSSSTFVAYLARVGYKILQTSRQMPSQSGVILARWPKA